MRFQIAEFGRQSPLVSSSFHVTAVGGAFSSNGLTYPPGSTAGVGPHAQVRHVIRDMAQRVKHARRITQLLIDGGRRVLQERVNVGLRDVERDVGRRGCLRKSDRLPRRRGTRRRELRRSSASRLVSLTSTAARLSCFASARTRPGSARLPSATRCRRPRRHWSPGSPRRPSCRRA